MQRKLAELLSLLKDKYLFHDETNKNILYNHEIERFAKLYHITNFCLVLSCYDSFFWLKDPNSGLEENLCYIEEYTLKLIPVKKANEEAEKWYEENKHTTTTFVVTDELLKPLEEKKKGSNKDEKQKKR
ncbi:11475_t:CDS:2 [Funneliformis geosporum]|uniref:2532_t:CDS:1 n=1 Tax=Funneliformis geosporum TaxID=1117311 RepID=A0A9W4SH88_9GLOM|nr:2532_t:CDS:2 [Funneliformis geosporum]CAI2171195.1 11475_t:CDS:2 [Funneliformis geosporum]